MSISCPVIRESADKKNCERKPKEFSPFISLSPSLTDFIRTIINYGLLQLGSYFHSFDQRFPSDMITSPASKLITEVWERNATQSPKGQLTRLFRQSSLAYFLIMWMSTQSFAE